MNHVSLIEEPRIAPRAPNADTPGTMPFTLRSDRRESPLATKSAPTQQARGRIVDERVTTATADLTDFDWVI